MDNLNAQVISVQPNKIKIEVKSDCRRKIENWFIS